MIEGEKTTHHRLKGKLGKNAWGIYLHYLILPRNFNKMISLAFTPCREIHIPCKGGFSTNHSPAEIWSDFHCPQDSMEIFHAGQGHFSEIRNIDGLASAIALRCKSTNFFEYFDIPDGGRVLRYIPLWSLPPTFAQKAYNSQISPFSKIQRFWNRKT